MQKAVQIKAVHYILLHGRESEISRPAVTDLPAGSGHLVAGTCPLAESAAGPCRSDFCWRPKKSRAVHIRAYACMTLSLMH